MEKLERDGKIGVLISQAFGAGWSTWNGEHAEALLMDKDLVSAFLDGGVSALASLARARYPDAYLGGVDDDMVVEWVPKGTRFKVTEYDGSERLEVCDWFIA